ncbi:MAG TPA: sigma-70 family RNA polymerase sigma factor [Gemmatales bacterium]|nr:sigma-70 family RNA polymerase sigma factor [Gemmatales bacterium]
MNRVLHYLQRGTTQSSSGDELTDQELLELFVQKRDQDAFADLVRRHELSVLKACRQVLRSAVDVDDAFQATFLVLIRRARQVRWQPSLRGWLVVVAHRIAVRLAMTQKRTASTLKSHDFSYDAASPLTEVSWQEACAVLHEELNQMRDQFRLPLLLCYLQGYSRDEAAAQLGWSLGSVKAGLERGRQQLKVRLEQRGVTLSAGLFTMLASSQTTEAGALSPVAATLALLTGNVPAKVAALSRGTGWAGTLLASRLALVALILLIGTAAGVTLTWARTPDEPVAATTVVPVSIISADDPENVTITGTVFDPGGKPIAGASISVVKFVQLDVARTNRQKLEPITTTDANGQFQFTTKDSLFYVVAQKAGYGFDVELIQEDKSKKPVQLQLRDQISVEGSVIDENGQRIANAEVECSHLFRYPPQFLEDQLKVIQETGRADGLYRQFSDIPFYFPFPKGLDWKVQTNAQGKFTLPELPSGMMAQLQFNKPKRGGTSLQVVLLKGFSDQGTLRHRVTATAVEEGQLRALAKDHNVTIEEARKRYQERGISRYYPPRVQVPMVPGVTVEGTITNERGEPLAGVPVVVTNKRGRGPRTVTDARGHYQVSELEPDESYSAHAYGHVDHLRAMGSAVHRNGGPIRIDLKMRQGAVLSGKVVDAKTGLGVRSQIIVQPTPGNPLLNKAGINLNSELTTKADGTFRIVAPPGDVIVTASAAPEKPTIQPNPFLPAKVLETDMDLLQSSGAPGAKIHFRGGNSEVKLGQAYHLLDLPTDRETSIELTLVRGKERPLKLVDSQGQPITRAQVIGLDQSMNAYEVKQAIIELVGLQLSEPIRPVMVVSREKNLGSLVMVPTNVAEPLVIQLEPLGEIKGRFIDSNDKPLSQIEIGLTPSFTQEQTTSNTLRFPLNFASIFKLYPIVYTDQEGRFTMTHVIPNMKFQLQEWNNHNGTSRSSRFFSTTYQLKPGQQLNLGESILQSR